jgi:hypothetical protein
MRAVSSKDVVTTRLPSPLNAALHTVLQDGDLLAA